jgi:hypothetical protein
MSHHTNPPHGKITNRSMSPGRIVPVLVYPDMDSVVAWLCEAFGFKERLGIRSHRAQLIFGGASTVVTDNCAGASLQTVSRPIRSWSRSRIWMDITSGRSSLGRVYLPLLPDTLTASASTRQKTLPAAPGPSPSPLPVWTPLSGGGVLLD